MIQVSTCELLPDETPMKKIMLLKLATKILGLGHHCTGNLSGILTHFSLKTPSLNYHH